MGATVQWRSEPNREPERFGKIVTFGNLRDKGTGYMAFSERVGPSVLLVSTDPGPDERTFADWLMGEGFTVLVPQLSGLAPDVALRIVTAGAEHLVDNWHPRLGIVGIGDAGAWAEEVARARPCDAVVTYADVAALVEGRAELADDFAYDLS
ncbi:MAG: hypothetical protein ACRDKT_03020 [Actinomycetota bacterium]